MSSTSRHHPDHHPAPAIMVSSGRTAASAMGFGWIPVASPSLVKRARWQDPPAHRAQSYPARVPKKKKEREKREAVSGPAGPAGCPFSHEGRGAGPVAKGRRGPGGSLSEDREGKKLCTLPGSLHSSPNQKLHLSICSNLNGPDRPPCSPSCPPVARCQRPSGGVTPQGAPGARRAGAILASPLLVREGV